MPFQRMTVLVMSGAAALCSTCGTANASPSPSADIRAYEMDSMSVMPTSPTLADFGARPALPDLAPVDAKAADSAPKPASKAPGTPDAGATAATAEHSLRKLLADFAVTLRDIRYRRGGREPSTGFDCSGFVRYVFRQSVGEDLPPNSASQYLAGDRVDRSAMKTGDLVFFRTRGKNISHVGIYLDNGRFIHSQSSGKGVRISHLDEAYWSKRFAGAKRPSVLS